MNLSREHKLNVQRLRNTLSLKVVKLVVEPMDMFTKQNEGMGKFVFSF